MYVACRKGKSDYHYRIESAGLLFSNVCRRPFRFVSIGTGRTQLLIQYIQFSYHDA